MNGTTRANIKAGLEVLIVLKKDQSTGKLTKGIVTDILVVADIPAFCRELVAALISDSGEKK